MNVNSVLTGDYLPLAGGTLTGNLTIGANRIITSNGHIYEDGVFRFTNTAETVYLDVYHKDLGIAGDITWQVVNRSIDGANTDGSVVTIKARDTGVGVIEVACFAGAADPYFSMGGSRQHKFYNSSDVDLVPDTGKSVDIGVSCMLKRFYAEVTLATDNAETDVGLTPAAVILSAAIRVSVQIDGLDSADHHIQLGINGNASKYIDVAQGGAAQNISVNKKGNYKFDPTTDTEAAALKLTITGGTDQIPTAGKVYVEVIYLDSANLADV
jgi:hypothetical protein